MPLLLESEDTITTAALASSINKKNQKEKSIGTKEYAGAGAFLAKWGRSKTPKPSAGAAAAPPNTQGSLSPFEGWTI